MWNYRISWNGKFLRVFRESLILRGYTKNMETKRLSFLRKSNDFHWVHCHFKIEQLLVSGRKRKRIFVLFVWRWKKGLFWPSRFQRTVLENVSSPWRVTLEGLVSIIFRRKNRWFSNIPGRFLPLLRQKFLIY